MLQEASSSVLQIVRTRHFEVDWEKGRRPESRRAHAEGGGEEEKRGGDQRQGAKDDGGIGWGFG